MYESNLFFNLLKLDFDKSVSTWAHIINVLLTAFTLVDPARMRQKRQSSWKCRLALLGPTSVKATHKTLVKLTPEAA